MNAFIGKLKLSRKLLIAPALAILSLVVFGGLSFWVMTTQEHALDTIVQEDYALAQRVHEIALDCSEAQTNFNKMINWARANYNGAKVEALGKDQFNHIDEAVNKVTQILQSDISDELKQPFREVLTETQDFKKAAATMVDLASFDLNAATMAMSTLEDKYTVLSSTVDNLIVKYNDLSQKSYEQATSNYHSIVLISFIVFAACVLCIIVVALKINATILHPVKGTTDVINVLASGDFTKDVPIYSQDEIGEMGRDDHALARCVRENLAVDKHNSECDCSDQFQYRTDGCGCSRADKSGE